MNVDFQKKVFFPLISNDLPLEKGVALHLDEIKIKSPFPNFICVLPSLVKIVPVVLKKMNMLNGRTRDYIKRNHKTSIVLSSFFSA